MTRQIDFTGRTAPYGGMDLKLELIVDIEDWVIVQHWPHAVLCSGSELHNHTFYCAKRKDMITEERVMPFFGMLSYYDLIDEVEADNE